MLRFFMSVAGLLGALALGGCGSDVPLVQGNAMTQPEAGPLLPPGAVRALYAAQHREDGEVLSGPHAGKHWVKWVTPDGTLRLSAAHGMFRDNGRVRVDGDKVCSTWETIDKGKTACMWLSKLAPDLYVIIDGDGERVSRFRVTVPGDPPGPLD